jgi:hypothetical protein
MKTGLCLVLTAVALALPPPCAWGTTGDAGVLLDAYLHHMILKQTVRQSQDLGRDLPVQDRSQVADEVTSWSRTGMKDVREALIARFGDDAQARFKTFVSELTAAEQAGDAAFLERLSAAAGIEGSVADFAALREAVMRERLAGELQDAADLLGGVEGWTEAKAKGAPDSLSDWLDRTGPRARTSAPVAAAPRAPAKKTGLAAAEVDVSEAEAPEDDTDTVSPLDSFSATRDEKRARVLAEAQAGMRQVADERRAWEQEYGARKQAEAQAEAEALIEHGEKLAAADKEAIEQSQRSWSNKAKQLLATAVGAAAGTFSGGVGAEAGQRAANEIFE